MADPLSNVGPGNVSPLVNNRAAVNLALDAARDFRDRRQGTGGPPGPLTSTARPALHARVKATGGTLNEFAIVGYGDAVLPVDPDAAARLAFAATPIFEAGAVGANSPFMVLEEPVASNAIGLAVCMGLAVCKVDVSDETHTRATPVTSDSTSLASAASGGVPVVWPPEWDGTGVQWAVVLLGDVDTARLYMVTAAPDTSSPYRQAAKRVKRAGQAASTLYEEVAPLETIYLSLIPNASSGGWTVGQLLCVAPDPDNPGKHFAWPPEFAIGSGTNAAGGSDSGPSIKELTSPGNPSGTGSTTVFYTQGGSLRAGDQTIPGRKVFTADAFFRGEVAVDLNVTVATGKHFAVGGDTGATGTDGVGNVFVGGICKTVANPITIDGGTF